MSILPPDKGSSFGRACIIFLLIALGTLCQAQSDQGNSTDAYALIYEEAKAAVAYDPFILNGAYYSFPYYNAVGHPFWGQKEFKPGSVVFRDKLYEELRLNYDIFHKQLIISIEVDGVLQMNLLNPEFASAFHLEGRKFIYAAFEGESADFYQAVSEASSLSCYYLWYKERREIRDSGNRSIYSFSEQKSRRYLLLDGSLYRYRSNKSFLKLLPEQIRNQTRIHMQDNGIEVMEASDQAMESLVGFCDKAMKQLEKGSGV